VTGPVLELEAPEAGSVTGTAELLGSVPDCDHHDRPPCRQEQILWQYLAPDKRMRRWTETIEILDLTRAQREMMIDFTLPDRTISGLTYLPAAFLGKDPVAPDLEVRDASGGTISVPTKRENMATTIVALDQLASAGLISFGADPALRALAHEVIREPNFEARVALLLAEARMGEDNDLLLSLLTALEDQFLLWVPITGAPRTAQQIEIRRRQILESNPVFRPRRVSSERIVDTAVGKIPVTYLAAEKRYRPSPGAAANRLLRVFGLAPFEYEHETAEAHRFASFHLRVMAPDGLIVRDVGAKVRAVPESTNPSPPLAKAPRSKPGLTYQGRESDLAHFHFAESENPSIVRAYTTFGIRGGMTTPWAGAAVFTALLLWAIHRLSPAGLINGESGALEATVGVLLIGPALASAWAIRADRGDLLESTLGGARALLFASAVLSVGVALSLAGFQPFRWDSATAVEVYAAVSYGVAALMVVTWALTLSPCWLLYRGVLTSARRNYATLFLMALLAGGVCVHGHTPVRLVGLTLLATGLVMAAVAAHPGRAAGSFSSGPRSAAIGACLTLLGGGWFLGFYENLASRTALQIAVVVVEATLSVVAAVQWYRN
jgi:hypothetical protein